MTINEKRREIDAVDAEIAELLCRRAEIAQEISLLKLRAGLPIADAAREDEILQSLVRGNCGSMSDEGLVRIYRVILEESRRVQAEARSGAASTGVAK